MNIAPSILTADFCQLGEVLDESIGAGINWIHLDVMDGNWVVNKTITFGPAVIRSIRNRVGPEVFLDCHLMITNAEQTWRQYADAGVNMVIAHVESVANFQFWHLRCMIMVTKQVWFSIHQLQLKMCYHILHILT